jgi:FkbM family methyltransferase
MEIALGLRNALRRIYRSQGWILPDWLLKEDEPYMRAVAARLGQGDVVIDLGAHVGAASIEFARRAGTVYAFEPHPETFSELKRRTRRFDNIHPMMKAVSDKTGIARLFYEPMVEGAFHEGASLVSDKDNLSYDNAVEVETVRLADFIDSLGKRVRLIKVDVEGAEYKVLSDLIESAAMAQVDEVHVECHVGRVAGLEAERAAFEARLAALGLTERFHLDWP